MWQNMPPLATHRVWHVSKRETMGVKDSHYVLVDGDDVGGSFLSMRRRRRRVEIGQDHDSGLSVMTTSASDRARSNSRGSEYCRLPQQQPQKQQQQQQRFESCPSSQSPTQRAGAPSIE